MDEGWENCTQQLLVLVTENLDGDEVRQSVVDSEAEESL